jgi:hypothetical protein
VMACANSLSHELGADRSPDLGIVDSEVDGLVLTYTEPHSMP